jgi:hypothetical protein
MAKAGDAQMLKFLLDRILPKERSVRVDLPPIDHASDAVDALRAIIDAVATGQIAPTEGSAIATLISMYARAVNDAKFDLRLDEIEKRQKAIQDAIEILQAK